MQGSCDSARAPCGHEPCTHRARYVRIAVYARCSTVRVGMPNRNVTISVPEDMYERVRRAAARASFEGDHTVTLAEWVRRAIAAQLEREKQ